MDVLINDISGAVENTDYSYQSAQTTLNSTVAIIVLVNLIDRWMDFERVKNNRLWLMGNAEVKPNRYIQYIKKEFGGIEHELMKQHYLYASSEFTGDYLNAFNPLDHVEEFFQELDNAIPVDIPTNEYYGSNWRLTTQDHYERLASWGWNMKRYLVIPIDREIKTKHKLIIQYGYDNNGVWVRDSYSPFPGNVQNFPLTITNIVNVEKNRGSDVPIKVSIGSNLDSYHFEGIEKRFGLNIPRDDAASVSAWIDDMFKLFTEQINKYGISMIG